MPNTLILAARGQPGGPIIVSDVLTHTGSVFFVGNAVTGAADDSSHGYTPDAPLLTLAAAVALCTAGKGDFIYLLPGHNENIGNAQIAISKSGITVQGLGVGGLRPRFDYDHANASIDITASNCKVANIVLLPSVTAVLIGIDVNTLVTDTVIEDVEVLPGEDGAGVDEFVVVVDIKVGCTRTRITRLKVRQHASAAGCIAGVQMNGASDDIEIGYCDIVLLGAGVTAPIVGVTTLSTNVRIHHNILVSDDEPGIDCVGIATSGVIYDNSIFSNLATIAAAIVATGCASFRNQYVEVGPESGAVIGTASVDD